MSILATYPSNGTEHINPASNVLITADNVSDVYSISVWINTVPAILNGVYQDGYMGTYSLTYIYNGVCYIYIAPEEVFSENTSYVVEVHIDKQTSMFSFSTTYDGDPAVESEESNLRHLILCFDTANKQTGFGDVKGFKFDETFFNPEKLTQKNTRLVSLWDPNTDTVPLDWFKSGIGGLDDLLPDTKLVNLKVGELEQWTLKLFHGHYYINKYLNFLYSDSAVSATAFSTESIPFEHSYVELSDVPKLTTPIFVGTYSSVSGNYVPSCYRQKSAFSSLDEDPTWACKYCNGTSCTYATQHPFAQEYPSDFMGTDFTENYEDTSDGRCANTACLGFCESHNESDILWSNVDTTNQEFVYAEDSNRLVFNFAVTSTPVSPRLVGYTSAEKTQEISLGYRYVSNVSVYIGGTRVSKGFKLFDIAGKIALNHSEIYPVELQNTIGYPIYASFSYGPVVIYEPENTTDYHTPLDLDLNPVSCGITNGFVSLTNSDFTPKYMQFSTSKESRDYTITDLNSGETLDVHGPLYLGNDYAYVKCHVMDESRKYGIPNVKVKFRQFFNRPLTTDLLQDMYETRTDANGDAYHVWTIPESAETLLTYFPITTDNDTFGTTTTFAAQDTLVLPVDVPYQCLVSSDGSFLVDLFAVFDDDTNLPFSESGVLTTYKADGRKELVFRYSDFYNEFRAVTPGRIGDDYMLYDSDGNLCTEPGDLVKKIVFYDSTDLASYLPHNTNTSVKAYCISLVGWMTCWAEIELGNETETYLVSSEKITLEVEIPAYMRGVFKITDYNAGEISTYDSTKYYTFDPTAPWSANMDLLDPKNLGHLIKVLRYATSAGLGTGPLSLRHLIKLYADYMSSLRHFILLRPTYAGKLRHVIFLGRLIESALRHSIIVTTGDSEGFDFTLDVIDPEEEGFDVEFDVLPAQQGGALPSGGADPTSCLTLNFFLTGSSDIVDPNMPGWPKYSGSSGGAAGSGATGSGVCRNPPLTGNSGTIYLECDLSGCDFSDKEAVNKRMFACLSDTAEKNGICLFARYCQPTWPVGDWWYCWRLEVHGAGCEFSNGQATWCVPGNDIGTNLIPPTTLYFTITWSSDNVAGTGTITATQVEGHPGSAIWEESIDVPHPIQIDTVSAGCSEWGWTLSGASVSEV